MEGGKQVGKGKFFEGVLETILRTFNEIRSEAKNGNVASSVSFLVKSTSYQVLS